MKEEEILTLLKDVNGKLAIRIECEGGADTFIVTKELERAIIEELKKHDFVGAVEIIRYCVR